MNLQNTINSDYIFSGEPELASSASIFISINGDFELIKLREIQPAMDISKEFPQINPEDVANALKLQVTDFDGIKIYNGRKKGLKLGYIKLNDISKFSTAIVSYGEYQPGRYMCYLDGYF